jgi:hypothetical protein
MRQNNLVQQIKDAVHSGKVKEPFKSSDFHFLSSSPSFISKHAVGNGKYTEYFIRVERGIYKLKIENQEITNIDTIQ